MREQREREAKRELMLAGEATSKQRGNADLSDRALADVAQHVTQGPASQHTDDLDDVALLDAERALVGTNGTEPDGR